MSDDLISRQAAIDALDGEIKLKDSDDVESVAHYIQQVARKINEWPSAEKKGKWLQRFYPQVEMMVCSECFNEFSYDAETGVRDYNFCPNCGARMVQKGEEDA